MDKDESDVQLRHITVLEEAHSLLKRTSAEQYGESANLLGKSVEMIANSIAEMRTYGEGFIIVDQSPGLLDKSVIRNTNTKIIMRLMDYSDRELVGLAAGLNENQIRELEKFERGVAVISQSGWFEPVLCKIDKFEKNSDNIMGNKNNLDEISFVEVNDIQNSLLDCIIKKEVYRKGDRIDIEKLKNDIIKSNLNGSTRCEFVEYFNLGGKDAFVVLQKLVYDILGASQAIDHARGKSDLKEWIHSVVSELNLSPKEYSKEEIDLIVALIIYEQVSRDATYNDLFCEYTEMHKKGGVF